MDRTRYCITLIALLALVMELAAPVFGQGREGKAPAPGVVGLNIQRADSGKVLVRDVEGGSPAEQAGLRKDDEILSIDGTDVAQLSTGKEVAEKIRGRAGTSVQLKMKREGKEKTVTLVWAPADELARRYMVRGIAAIEMAKTQADYVLAAQEFEQAAKLAPDNPDAYYNLGNVQSKLGDVTSAIKNLQRYLELAPNSPDAAKVRDEIYKLEYRRDRQQIAVTLSGKWSDAKGKTYQIVLDGARIQIKREEQQGDDDLLTIKSMGTHTGPMTDVPLIFLGIMSGDKTSGQYIYPAGRYGGYCDVPERKGNFQGTIDVAAGQIRIIYDRVQFEYEMKFKSLFSDEAGLQPDEPPRPARLRAGIETCQVR